MCIVYFVSVACERSGNPEAGGRFGATQVTHAGDTTVATTRGAQRGSVADAVIEWSLVANGAREFSDSLGDIADIAIGSDGRIAIWDPKTPSVWTVPPDGSRLVRLGRYGAGPGEYGRVAGLTFVHDSSLAILDMTNRRIVWFTPSGSVIASVPVPAQTPQFPAGIASDSLNQIWVIGTVHAPGNENAAIRRAWFRVDTARNQLDTVPTPVQPDNYKLVAMRIRENGLIGARVEIGVPFAPQPTFALSRSGQLWEGDGARYVINGTHAGKPYRIERQHEPVSVSQKERAAREASITKYMRDIQSDWTWSGIPIPDVKPPYIRIQFALDDHMWVQLSPPDTTYADERARRAMIRGDLWDVFEPTGNFLGRVRFPPSFAFATALGNAAWGTMRDSDGLATVVKLRYEFPR